MTVSSHLKANQIKMRRLSPTEEQIDRMVKLYESGLSLLDVGRKLNMSATTVLRHLQQRGIKTRDPHGNIK